MKTGQEYIDSLRQLKPNLYYRGKKIENPVDHPAIRPHINSAAVAYDFAFNPEFEDLATATSHLTGKKINRFTHIHMSDAMNAVYSVTFEMDLNTSRSRI